MYYQFYIVLSIVLLIHAPCSDSAKIMGVFPFPSRSHQILGSALLKELATRGHEVWMMSPFPLKEPFPNYTDIYIDKVLDENDKQLQVLLSANVSYYTKFKTVLKNMEFIGEAGFESKDYKEFMKNDPKIDLIIQFFASSEAYLGLGHKLNASTIAFFPVGPMPSVSYISGNPSPYSYVPNGVLRYSDKMDFLQRVINTLSNVAMEIFVQWIILPLETRILEKYFPDAPPMHELIDNVDLTLINSHVATEYPRPYLPNVVQIGGFHLQEKMTLPKDIKQYIDESKHGVIYFSLGTNVKGSFFSKTTTDAILQTFSKLKYNVIWKYELELPNKPKNVFISKWLPQRAILAHPNIKAFITHGGMGGTVEAVHYGVPMICMPFFGDQMKNVESSVNNGYAIHLDADDITEETLTAAIQEIMENPKYLTNIKLKSDLLRNQEMNPMDKAMFWIEHVIKHKGAKHMKGMAAKIPLYQYLLLDVIAFISVIGFTVLALIYIAFKKCISLCCRKTKTKKIKKN